MSTSSSEGISEASQPTDETGERYDSNKPHPIQIVVVKEDHTFDLDMEALKEVLLSEEVSNRRVVVISVAGAFRKGKSFLLDYLLRFLNNKGLEGNEDWMGEEDEALVGFSWRGGFERDTTGILMWSQPFITTLSSGEEVAILLLDTQGAFDRLSTVQDNATIFALSTMISSIQVYNLILQVQEDDLQHLQLFTEYGKIAMMEQASTTKPFQTLVFLVRDWYHQREYAHGLNGGKDYLDVVLKISPTQHEDLKSVRKHIRDCFSEVSCFLMPSPGSKVQSGDSDGRLSEMDSSFRRELKAFSSFLLSLDRLVVKKINGLPLTGAALFDIFGVYMKIFQSSDLPVPMSMLKATAQANNISALITAFDKYSKEMDQLCGADTPYLSVEKLKEAHLKFKRESIAIFQETPRMGGNEIGDEYLAELEHKIDVAYESFVKRNESKHILNAYRTPAVLGVVMILSYLISTILDTFGIESLSQTAIFGLYIPLIMLFLWMYIRYSGEWREIGQMIDNITTTIWEQTLQPIYGAMVKKALNQAVNLATQDKEKRE